MLIKVEMISFLRRLDEMNWTDLLTERGIGCHTSAAASSSSELI